MPSPTKDPDVDSEIVTPDMFVTLDIFYDLIQAEDMKILVLDTRSDRDFRKAHVKCKYICNIPSDIINKGLKLDIIVKLMDEKIKQLFESCSFDLVIMMDEDTTIMSYPGSKLQYLRTILIDDNNSEYQILPLVLNKGFNVYKNYYPTEVTEIVSKSFEDTIKEIRSLAAMDRIHRGDGDGLNEVRNPQELPHMPKDMYESDDSDDSCPGTSTSEQKKSS